MIERELVEFLGSPSPEDGVRRVKTWEQISSYFKKKGISSSLVYSHLKNLVNSGKVDKVANGDYFIYTIVGVTAHPYISKKENKE